MVMNQLDEGEGGTTAFESKAIRMAQLHNLTLKETPFLSKKYIDNFNHR